MSSGRFRSTAEKELGIRPEEGLRWMLSPPVGADPRVCPPCVPILFAIVRADTGVCPYRWVCHSSLEGYRVPLGGDRGGLLCQ